MNIKAITVKENKITSEFEDCFGKAKYFCFLDEFNNYTFIENPGVSEEQHSGKKAVEFIRSKGVCIIISRNYGLSVKKLLDKYKIQTVIVPEKYKQLSQLLKNIRNNKSNS